MMTADHPGEEWRALVARFPAFGPTYAADAAPLRDHVCRFVRAAKGRGEASEQILRALREHTSPAILAHVPREFQRRLLDDVFQWCLDEYYGPKRGAAPPSRVDEGPMAGA